MNHVIIIDDEVQSRNGIAEIFKNHSPGWEIDGLFEDGSLALDYLSTTSGSKSGCYRYTHAQI